MKPCRLPRADQPLTRVSFYTTLGLMTLTASAKGLIAITLPRQPAPKTPEPPPPKFTRLIESLRAYFDGKKVCFDDIKIDLSAATPFRAAVWEVTRSIPYGDTRSYRWVAGQIGRPEATRAVGQALGRNPLPVIVPCHRVITSDGSLGGFALGRDVKAMLLSLEQGRAL